MLKYFYDKEADIFYFSEGEPSVRDASRELGDDVVVRLNPRTKRVRGFTLLNASRRSTRASTPAMLPFTLETIAAR